MKVSICVALIWIVTGSALPLNAADTLQVKVDVQEIGAVTLTMFDAPDSLFGGISDAMGSQWFHTRNRAVRFDGNQWVAFGPEDGVPESGLYRMEKTTDGALWFFGGEAQKTTGLMRYQNGIWHTFSSSEIGLDDIAGVYQLKDGTVWAIGANEGVGTAAKFDPRIKSEAGSSAEFIPNKAESLRIGSQTWTTYGRANGLRATRLRQMIEANNGDLYFGTESDGVLRSQAGRTEWTAFTTDKGLAHNAISGLFQEPDGRIWAGTSEGVSWFDPKADSEKAWTSYKLEEGFPFHAAREILSFRGETWLAFTYFWYAGAARYNGKTWKMYSAYEGLAHNFVSNMIAEGDDALWFATDSGISRFDGATWMSVRTKEAVQVWKAGDNATWFVTMDGNVGKLTANFDQMVTAKGKVVGSDGAAKKGVSVDYSVNSGRLYFKISTDEFGHYRAQVFPDSYRVHTFGDQVQKVVLTADKESHIVDFVAEPAIVRVAFPVTNSRREELERAYQKDILPVLKNLDLRPLTRKTRAVSDTIFTQLFEIDAPGHLRWKQLAFGSTEAVKSFMKTFGYNQDAEGIVARLHLYSTPFGAGRITTPIEPTTHILGSGTTQKSVGRTIRAGSGNRKGVWKTLSVADGLVSNTVRTVLQDRSDRLYFATAGGVCRYDGENLTTYTTEHGLADNRVNQILEDTHGSLWIATLSGGLCRLDGETMTRFTVEDGLPDNRVGVVFEDDAGRIWIGTFRGLVCLDGRNMKTYSVEHGLANPLIGHQIYQDTEGLYLCSNARQASGTMGLTYFDGQRFTVYAEEDGLPFNRVYAVLRDRKGMLWFGTEGGGLCRYDGRHLDIFTTADGLADNEIQVLIEDSDGVLWIGTSGGVSKFDGHHFETFTVRDGLAYDDIRSIFEDREGNLWFGTGQRFVGGGVSRYDGRRYVNLTSKDGLPSDLVWSLHKDSAGDLLIGTDGGLSRFRSGVITNFTTDNGLPVNKIASIIEARGGGLWLSHGLPSGFFSGAAGITHYDDHRFKTLTMSDGLIFDRAGPMLIDKRGDLWVGTGRGVSRYDGKTFTNWGVKQGLPGSQGNARVEALLEDKNGRIWAGLQGGVVTFDGDSVTIMNTKTPSDDWVHALLEDRTGNMWFGTDAGAVRYDPSAESIPSEAEGLRTGSQTFTTYTTQDGLVSDKVSSLLEDSAGHIWFGTSGGVSRTDGLVIQHLRQQNGLLDNRVNTLMLDDNGDVLIGTEGGLTRYRPGHSPPEIELIRIAADREYEPGASLSLDTSQDLIAFEFKGRSFKTAPDQMAYAFRLEGYDKDWRWTRDRRVTYSNLPRGDYRFEVKAVDLDLTYSAQASAVALNVHLPYERMGLLSALGIAVLLVGWQSVRVVRRDRRLQQANRAMSDANKKLFQVNVDLEDVNKELFQANIQIQEQTERKSAFLASMSHELRTPMNAIKGFTSLVLRREESLSERGQENLKKVGQASDHLLTMINDLLDLSKIEAGRMDVHPTTFTVKHLITYCVSTVNPLVKEGVTLSYEIADDVGEAHTDEVRVRQMVINLLSNAIKFTDTGEVTVTAKIDDGRRTTDDGKNDESLQRSNIPTFQRSNAMLVIAVSDTGKGIPQDELPFIFDEYRQVKGSESSVQKGTGLGLSITKKFADLLGGNISVESEVEKGTTFTVKIPLDYERQN